MSVNFLTSFSMNVLKNLIELFVKINSQILRFSTNCIHVDIFLIFIYLPLKNFNAHTYFLIFVHALNLIRTLKLKWLPVAHSGLQMF